MVVTNAFSLTGKPTKHIYTGYKNEIQSGLSAALWVTKCWEEKIKLQFSKKLVKISDKGN